MEKYLTNHSFKNLQKLSAILGRDLVFVDLETTGLLHEPIFSVIEVGLISISADKIQEANTLINPGVRIPANITELTGITNAMVANKPDFSNYVKYFNKISKNSILMGYNSKAFDSKALEKMGRMHELHYSFKNQLDVRYTYIRERNERLKTKGMSGSLMEAAQFHNIYLKGTAHRAGYDIALTALVAENILEKAGMQIIKKDVDKIECMMTKTRFDSSMSLRGI